MSHIYFLCIHHVVIHTCICLELNKGRLPTVFQKYDDFILLSNEHRVSYQNEHFIPLLITNSSFLALLPSFRPCSLDRDPSSRMATAACVHAWQLSRILYKKKHSIDVAMAKPFHGLLRYGKSFMLDYRFWFFKWQLYEMIYWLRENVIFMKREYFYLFMSDMY